MEVFLFCYAPLQFQTRAICVPIELMDVGTFAEMEKIMEKVDEKGYLINNFVKVSDETLGNCLKSLNEYPDIKDILDKWKLYSDDSPSNLIILFGIDLSDGEDEDGDSKIPEWYKKSYLYYGNFKHRETFEKLKNMTEMNDGKSIVVKYAVLYQEMYKE